MKLPQILNHFSSLPYQMINEHTKTSTWNDLKLVEVSIKSEAADSPIKSCIQVIKCKPPKGTPKLV